MGLTIAATGWNVSYAWAWEEVAAVTGVFDGEPREDFEDQWRSNQSYAWSWGSVTSQSPKNPATHTHPSADGQQRKACPGRPIP